MNDQPQKDRRIDCLDHGFVRLIDWMGSDLAISRAARVSYDAPPREEDAKLIAYLMKNRHSTPFEAVEFQFEVKAPIFVFRQWHRHRTATINELSARYRELPEEFYVPRPIDVGQQSKDSKQARVEDDSSHGKSRGEAAVFHIQRVCEASFDTYRFLIGKGVPRELARMVLPLNTYSHMFWKTDLHNLFHFLTLRQHEHAQYEIRVFADAMLGLIRPVVPIAVAAFDKNRRYWEHAARLMDGDSELG